MKDRGETERENTQDESCGSSSYRAETWMTRQTADQVMLVPSSSHLGLASDMRTSIFAS